jgi:hypothetical protein
MEDFKDMNEEDLQIAIEDMTTQLTEAKKAYREKRLAGVRLAIESRKQADEDLSEELRKLGVPYRSRDMFSSRMGLTYRL